MSLYHNLLPAAGGGALLPAPIPSGSYFDQRVNGNATTTVAGVADRLEMYPIRVGANVTLQEIAAEVATGNLTATFKLGIYSDANGVPGNLLAGGVTDHDAAAAVSNTFRTQAISLALSAGVTYWLAIHHSGIPTMRALSAASVASFGVPTGSNPGPLTGTRATATYASGLPSTAPAMTPTASVVPVLIRLRAA